MMDANDLIPDRGWIHRYVEHWTPQTEAPATSHLGAALAVMSAAVGWKGWLQWGDALEPCNLYVMLEGRSATAKKTTVAQMASRTVWRAFKGMEAPPLSVMRVQQTSQRGLLEAIGTQNPELAKEWDETPPPGVILDWDEFGSVLGKPGDSKTDWLGQIRASLMAMYGGRHGGIQTGQLKVYPSRCAVAVLATMTRVELEQRVSTGLLRDGFLGRFLLIPNDGRRDWLAFPPDPVRGASDSRDQLARDLDRIASDTNVMGDVFKRHTADARRARTDWYRATGERLEVQANNGGDVEKAMADAFGRLQSAAVKISAVLAVSEMMEGDRITDIQIEERHALYGIRIAEFALEEIRSLATSGHGTPQDQAAVKIVDYLSRRNGKGPASRKELLDAVAVDGLTRPQKWAVVEELHKEGTVWINPIKGTGGRPREEVSLMTSASA